MKSLRTESGKLWTMTLGDCKPVLRSMLNANERVDHCITDPPYEREAHTLQRRLRTGTPTREKKVGVKTAPISFDAIDSSTRTFVAFGCSRLVRRWSLFFCQNEAAHKWQSAGELSGLVHKRVGIWIKPDAMPQLTGDRPGVGYETIEIMHTRGRSTWNGGGKRGVWIANSRQAGVDRLAKEHETVKPDLLMLALVDDFTIEGETILDMFAGSGSTGVAAIRRNRKFIGVERDKKYFELACARLTAEENETTLSAARAGQSPLFAKVES
jgi:site-specific DNA-methyltransferase (adenine-specific)